MKKVITYGTFDLLHYGHIRLLERAKELGDYLIVGVTSDDFDKKRGKINVSQSLMERIQSVKDTGLADEIIVEEYEGQKIDDIINYGIDIFTLGSDWEGKFDYLKEYCKVVYLPRTKGVSSSELRSESRKLKMGFVGENYGSLRKFSIESKFVNGMDVEGFFIENNDKIDDNYNKEIYIEKSYKDLLKKVDAVYLISHPKKHYEQIKMALENKKHVLCEAPIVLDVNQLDELYDIANKNNCILMESTKTAYQTAYSRLLLLLKGGIIGKIVSVESTCTSLRNINNKKINNTWNSICSWGPTAMLPVFQILGTKYSSKEIKSIFIDKDKKFDIFTKIDFIYKDSVASIKVGKGVKSEGELIVSGTKGCIYVPSPWWKMDYFEVRYENPLENKKYFYELNGEGIRNELVVFLKSIEDKRIDRHISQNVTKSICKVIEDFETGNDVVEINN